MASQGDDCYFFYYSQCAKGALCPFRHCEAALGSETICTLWKDGNCTRQWCRFRHMDIKKDRSAIPCYWESQPGGCQKPHCVFQHVQPRDGPGAPAAAADTLLSLVESPPVPSTKAQVGVTAVRRLSKDADLSADTPSPKMEPLVFNPFEGESDVESTGSSPVKKVGVNRLQRSKAAAGKSNADAERPLAGSWASANSDPVEYNKSLQEYDSLAEKRHTMLEAEGATGLTLMKRTGVMVHPASRPTSATDRRIILVDDEKHHHKTVTLPTTSIKSRLGLPAGTTDIPQRRVLDRLGANRLPGQVPSDGEERRVAQWTGSKEETRSVTHWAGSKEETRSVRQRLGIDQEMRSVCQRLGTDEEPRTVQQRLGTGQEAGNIQQRLGTGQEAGNIQQRLGTGQEAGNIRSRLGGNKETTAITRGGVLSRLGKVDQELDRSDLVDSDFPRTDEKTVVIKSLEEIQAQKAEKTTSVIKRVIVDNSLGDEVVDVSIKSLEQIHRGKLRSMKDKKGKSSNGEKVATLQQVVQMKPVEPPAEGLLKTTTRKPSPSSKVRERQIMQTYKPPAVRNRESAGDKCDSVEQSRPSLKKFSDIWSSKTKKELWAVKTESEVMAETTQTESSPSASSARSRQATSKKTEKWGVKTFSEIMAEKRRAREKEQVKRKSSTDVSTKETNQKKGKFTPISFDLENETPEVARHKFQPVTFDKKNLDTFSRDLTGSKTPEGLTRPAKKSLSPSLSTEAGITTKAKMTFTPVTFSKDEQENVEQTGMKRQHSASTPLDVTPPKRSRVIPDSPDNVQLDLTPKGNLPVSRSSGRSGSTRSSKESMGKVRRSISRESSNGTADKRKTSIRYDSKDYENDELFLDVDLDDLLGDEPAISTALPHDSKSEEDLLLEMEELLA